MLVQNYLSRSSMRFFYLASRKRIPSHRHGYNTGWLKRWAEPNIMWYCAAAQCWVHLIIMINVIIIRAYLAQDVPRKSLFFFSFLYRTLREQVCTPDPALSDHVYQNNLWPYWGIPIKISHKQLKQGEHIAIYQHRKEVNTYEQIKLRPWKRFVKL